MSRRRSNKINWERDREKRLADPRNFVPRPDPMEGMDFYQIMEKYPHLTAQTEGGKSPPPRKKPMQKIAKTPFEAASLARVWQHTQDTNIGVLTAHRAANRPEVNKQNNADLAAAIRAAGFGYLKVKGRYVENYGTPQAKNVDENSYLVIGKQGDDSGNLKGFLKQQGAKFDQDSILYKSYDDESAYLIGTNAAEFPGYGNEHPIGKWHPNRMAEFHSVLFPGKSFTFEAAMAKPRLYERIGFYNQKTFSAREESEF